MLRNREIFWWERLEEHYLPNDLLFWMIFFLWFQQDAPPKVVLDHHGTITELQVRYSLIELQASLGKGVTTNLKLIYPLFQPQNPWEPMSTHGKLPPFSRILSWRSPPWKSWVRWKRLVEVAVFREMLSWTREQKLIPKDFKAWVKCKFLMDFFEGRKPAACQQPNNLAIPEKPSQEVIKATSLFSMILWVKLPTSLLLNVLF